MPFSYVTLLPDERIFKAVNVVLSLQNGDGGWATYELMRGPALLEHLNPSETFHGIMVDYPYVECSSACVQALARFQQHYPGHRSAEIKYERRVVVARCCTVQFTHAMVHNRTSIEKGIKYILSIQRPDGSWYVLRPVRQSLLLQYLTRDIDCM